MGVTNLSEYCAFAEKTKKGGGEKASNLATEKVLIEQSLNRERR